MRKNPDHQAKGADESQSSDQFSIICSQGSDTAKVPAPRDCKGDRAGYDSSPSSKWVKKIYVNRISSGRRKRPRSSGPRRPRAWLADHFRCGLLQNISQDPDPSADRNGRSHSRLRESIGKNSFRPFRRCSGRWQARLLRRGTVHSIRGSRCGSLE